MVYFDCMIKYELKKADDLSSALVNLYELLTLLRSPEGCPWDRKQTGKSSMQSLIDEAYEYIDGFNKEDVASCREEIGDVLINALMILRIHEENNDFSPVDAVNEVCEKLYRRHPHVFGDKEASSAEDGLTYWNQVKSDVEGKNRTPEEILAHIPSSLPPLERCFEVRKKLAKMGFAYASTEEVIDKVYEELDEVKDAIAEGNQIHIEEELGDLLCVTSALCEYLGIRPAVALDRANRKIDSRFKALFDIAKEKEIPVDSEHAHEIYSYWKDVKKKEK